METATRFVLALMFMGFAWTICFMFIWNTVKGFKMYDSKWNEI